MSSKREKTPRLVQALALALAISGLLAGRGMTQWAEPGTPPTAIFAPFDGRSQPDGFVPGVVLVRLSSANDRSADVARQLNVPAESLAPLMISGQPSLYRVSVPQGQEEAEARRLAALPHVLYAEPDYLVFAADTALSDTTPNNTTPNNTTPNDTTPNDTLYNRYQWNLRHIRANTGWDRTTGSNSVIIAIVDTGVDLSHPDLIGRIVPGIDTVNNDWEAQDDHGHGTHVASVAAANSNNGAGIAGVNWYARIMPVKALNQDGAGSNSQLATGITWAADNGANIINMSLASNSSSTIVRNAVNYAHSRGVLLIAAAGNHYANGNPTSYPAAYDHVLGVAAVNDSDGHAGYSNSGGYVDVAAPGGDPAGSGDSDPRHWIAGAYWRGAGVSYALLSGTSQAAPQVAGLAGLLLALNPALTPDQLSQLITSTALDVQSPGWDSFSGHGRIDVAAALAAVQPPATATATATATPSPTASPTATPTATPTPTPPPRSRDDVRINSSSLNDQSGPVLAIDSPGNLTALWLDWRSGSPLFYSARMGATAANWGVNLPVSGSRQISPTDQIGLPHLTVSADGEPLAVWHDDQMGNDETDIYLSRQIGGVWSAPMQINDDTQPPAAQTDPVLVAGADGSIVAVWVDGRSLTRAGATPQLYWSRQEKGGGNWSQAQPLAPSTLGQGSPALAVGPAAIYAVWVEASEESSRLLFSQAELSESSAHTSVLSIQAWATPTLLLATTDGGEIRGPEVATDGGGRILVVWEEAENGLSRIRSLHGSTASGWSSPTAVTSGGRGQGQFSPRLAASAREVALVWQEQGNDPGDIYISWASWATRVWSPSYRVNQDSAPVLQSEPDAALDAWGHTTIVWSDGRGAASAPDIYARFIPAGERYRLYLPETRNK